MLEGLITSAYIVAAILFIMSLAGLSKQETAKNGNRYGVIGMTIALVATILLVDPSKYSLCTNCNAHR